jgi:hypothetical protein
MTGLVLLGNGKLLFSILYVSSIKIVSIKIETANVLAEDDQGYEHISIYGYESEVQTIDLIKTPDAALLHYLYSRIEKGNQPADVMGGIIITLHQFSQQFAKKKVMKNIFVFTSLEYELNMDGMDAIVDKIKEMDVLVNFILFDSSSEQHVGNNFPFFLYI